MNSWIYFCLFLALNVWHTSLKIQSDASSGLVRLLIEGKDKKKTSLFKLKFPQFGSFNEKHFKIEILLQTWRIMSYICF